MRHVRCSPAATTRNQTPSQHGHSAVSAARRKSTTMARGSDAESGARVPRERADGGCSVQAEAVHAARGDGRGRRHVQSRTRLLASALPPSLFEHDLVTVFQVGWTAPVSRGVDGLAEQVLDALDDSQTSDQDLQFGLRVLRRELRKQRRPARRGARATGSRPSPRSNLPNVGGADVALRRVSGDAVERLEPGRPAAVHGESSRLPVHRGTTVTSPRSTAFLQSLTELLV